MENKEKDQADFDLETFVDLFDTAMTSDNPTVQRAFKNLMIVATLVSAEDANKGLKQGPLRKLVEDMNNISRRLSNVEAKNTYNNPYTTTIPTVGTPYTTTIPTVGTPYSGTNGPTTTWASTGYVNTNASMANTVSVTNTGYTIDQMMLDKLYKDLESK
jgi:hypothetical protein